MSDPRTTVADTNTAEQARLWQAYCDAQRRAHETLRLEDGIAAGHAWAAWVKTFSGAPVIADSRCITIADIQAAVGAHYGVSRVEINSERRSDRTALARHAAMYLSREMTPHTMATIGRAFGGRDHTTVIYAVRKIEAAGEPLAGEVAALRADLERRFQVGH